jgi:hypothetical protein
MQATDDTGSLEVSGLDQDIKTLKYIFSESNRRRETFE